MIRAVTFDLWDTLVVDDSDEEVRAALELPSKQQARESALLNALEVPAPDPLCRKTRLSKVGQLSARRE